MALLMQIDKQSTQPIYQQIINRVVELIDSEALEPGTPLPSSRTLAGQLGVNRSTVYKAYQELWSMGYVESRPGSYSWVRKRPKAAVPRDAGAPGLIPWPRRSQAEAAGLYQEHLREEALINRANDPGIYNFIPLMPDSRLFPLDPIRKCMNETLINEGMELLQYGDPLGYEPLRRYIASRMRQHGISVSAPEVMITKGAQNAFELLIRLLTKPGAAVLVEAPTYSRAIDLFRLSGLQIMEVPMNKGGMDLDALEGLLSQASPDLIYTIPNFHNPTGTTTSQGHRERLFRLCLKHQVPLVEDGFEEELKYFGKAVLPIKSMDSQGVVIYVGTFSKILFPGLRIGWIAADQECIQRLAPLQKASLVAGNLLDQAALHRFCALGHYDRHIKRMHRVYRRRMLVALKAMQAHLDPKKVEWTKPQGGYTTWLRLKGLPLSEDEVLDHLFQCKVALLPGSTHYYGPTQGLCFRLSIAILDEAAIEQGIQRLGQGISQLYQSARGKKG